MIILQIMRKHNSLGNQNTRGREKGGSSATHAPGGGLIPTGVLSPKITS